MENIHRRKNQERYIKIASPFQIVDKYNYISLQHSPQYVVGTSALNYRILNVRQGKIAKESNISQTKGEGNNVKILEIEKEVNLKTEKSEIKLPNIQTISLVNILCIYLLLKDKETRKN